LIVFVTHDDLALCSFDNLFVLVALCNAATLLPAPFLRLLPPELEKDPDDSEETKADGTVK